MLLRYLYSTCYSTTVIIKHKFNATIALNYYDLTHSFFILLFEKEMQQTTLIEIEEPQKPEDDKLSFNKVVKTCCHAVYVVDNFPLLR